MLNIFGRKKGTLSHRPPQRPDPSRWRLGLSGTTALAPGRAAIIVRRRAEAGIFNANSGTAPDVGRVCLASRTWRHPIAHFFQSAQRFRQERDHPDPSNAGEGSSASGQASRTLPARNGGRVRSVRDQDGPTPAKPPDYEGVRRPWCLPRARRRAGFATTVLRSCALLWP